MTDPSRTALGFAQLNNNGPGEGLSGYNFTQIDGKCFRLWIENKIKIKSPNQRPESTNYCQIRFLIGMPRELLKCPEIAEVCTTEFSTTWSHDNKLENSAFLSPRCVSKANPWRFIELFEIFVKQFVKSPNFYSLYNLSFISPSRPNFLCAYQRLKELFGKWTMSTSTKIRGFIALFSLTKNLFRLKNISEGGPQPTTGTFLFIKPLQSPFLTKDWQTGTFLVRFIYKPEGTKQKTRKTSRFY